MIIGKPDPYAKVPMESYAEYGRLAIRRDQIEMRMGALRQQIIDAERQPVPPKEPVTPPKPPGA